jgi:RNA polymerase sigma-70 factor (ECF subfamily)
MERDAVEATVRSACERGDFEQALEAALRGFGPEIYGFLVAMHTGEADAADVFSRVSEAVWKGLPKFRWDSTLRTWLYVVARHALYDHRARAHRELVPLDEASIASRLAVAVRTETRSWLRTAQKDRFTQLRASLALEDQELLILRIDRGLPWEELARITLAGDPSAEQLKREAARLRKRFQLVRHELRELGRRAGLIGDSK